MTTCQFIFYTMSLILVDGSAYLFRAYHALPHLTNKEGFPTSALFGVLNMLKKLHEDFKPERILIVFDMKGKNFRHHLYADYKANRSAMPEDLAVQIEPLIELIQLLGFPLYRHAGVEADDVIGSLARQAVARNETILIISSDKDLAQLLEPKISIFDPMKNIHIDATYLQNKLEILPNQMVDFLALTGDSSDNIPGLPGVGPKTAAKWLKQYQNLDNIIVHQHEISGKVGESLRTHLAQVELAKKLTQINCHLDLNDLPDFSMQSPNTAALLPLLYTYELKSWIKALESSAPELSSSNSSENTELPAQAYQLISQEAEFTAFIELLKAQKVFAFDTETTSLDPMRAEMLGISFSWAPGQAYFVILAHQFSPYVDKTLALKTLKPIMENPGIQKVAQNAKYDWHVLKNEGIQLQGLAFDTLLASYILNSTANIRHDLNSQVERELGVTGISFDELVGKGKNALPLQSVPIENLCHYASEDADFTWQLYQKYQEQFAVKSELAQVFYNLELPLVTILAEMEHYGVYVDARILHALSQQWQIRLQEIMRATFIEAGTSFNLNSPKQLLEILYQKMQLPITHKTPKGEPSTNEAALQELAPNFKIAELLLEHRHLSKLKSTYADKLALMINPITKRIHTQYQQAIAVTGRLSSIAPNLQNIPMKTANGRKIRSSFVAPEGCKIISADYSQIELRIMAHLSQDPSLLNAFHHNKDIHRATASEILGIPETEVSDEQRRHAKAVNFGLIYGMSAFGLARQLHIGRKEAGAYIKRYFERYPGVLSYMETTRAEAHQLGYVETLLGRRLYLPALHSKNMMEKKGAERAAINAPLQGTAADIIKKAMLDFNQWLQTHPEQKAHLIMQVHDELVVESNLSAVATVAQALKTSMEQACPLSVPLLVDVDIGDSWGT